MTDVAIIGVGLHPFGRTPGKSGLQQGAFAAREALRDAGAEWSDMQFAFGGSTSSGSADAPSAGGSGRPMAVSSCPRPPSTGRGRS